MYECECDYIHVNRRAANLKRDVLMVNYRIIKNYVMMVMSDKRSIMNLR